MGRLTPLTLAVAVTCVAAPAMARAHGPRLLPVERVACLSPIPGQECSEEEHGRLCSLCTEPAARVPEPVVVDCHDPSVEWVQEMVGECDMPPRAGEAVFTEADREHPRGPTCLDGEACGAPRPPLAAAGLSLDLQPVAIAGHAALDQYAPGGRLTATVLLRRDPGHRPRLLRPPQA